MTLLEILVKELPRRGGWPEGVEGIEMFDNGLTYLGQKLDYSLGLTRCSDGWRGEGAYNRKDNGERYSNAVTREQYEAALAASKRLEWNGEGLPPVGCECEIKRVADWMPVTIKFISDYHTIFTTFGGTEDCYQTTSLQFRPIRPEADRKRDEAVGAMLNAQSYGGQDVYCDIYDAIAAGKIPGIRIE